MRADQAELNAARDFGSRLAQRRRAAKLSQSELAGDDLSPSYISLLESGKRQPSSEVVSLLAARLSCSPSMLLTGDASERERRIELEINYARLALTHGEAADARTQLTGLLAEGGLDSFHEDEATLLLASAHENLGEFPAAIDLLLPLFERSRKGGTHLPVSSVGVVLCGCYSDSGDYQRAVIVGQEALDAAIDQGLSGSEDYYRLAATVLWAYCETGDLSHGMAWARTLIAQAEAHGTPSGQAAIYWNAAVVAHSVGNVGEAIHLSMRALAKMSEGHNTRDLARLRVAVAQLLLSADPPRTDEAWASLEIAHDPLLDLGSQVDKAHWERTAGLTRLLQGDLDQARAFLDAALRRADACEPEDNAESWLILGDLESVRGNLMVCREHYGRAIDVLSTAAPRRATARLWRDVGDRLREVGDVQTALTAFQRALDLLKITDRNAPVRAAMHQARELHLTDRLTMR